MDVIKVELLNNYRPETSPRGCMAEVRRRRVTDKLLQSFLISSSLTRKPPAYPAIRLKSRKSHRLTYNMNYAALPRVALVKSRNSAPIWMRIDNRVDDNGDCDRRI